jgi:hypothetical protein
VISEVEERILVARSDAQMRLGLGQADRLDGRSRRHHKRHE